MPNKYWIGGTGNNWSTAANWSLISGTPSPTSVPSVLDDAYFDAASGSGTVIVTAGATAANIYFTNGTTGSFGGTLNMAANLAVVNNFTLSPAVGFSVIGTATLNKTGNVGTLTSNAKTWSGGMSMPTIGSTLTTFGDNWTITGNFTASVSNSTNITAAAMRTISIGGNLSSGGGSNCTNITFVLTGSGTLSGIYTGFSVAGFVIQINASGNITQNALSIANGTFTYTTAANYTSTAIFSIGGTSGVAINNVSGITFSSVGFLAAGGQNIALSSNMKISGGLAVNGGTAGAINGAFTVFVGGNLSPTNGLSGTATIEMDGPSAANVSTGIIDNSLTINKSSGAVVTFTGNVTWGNFTATRTLNLNTSCNFGLTTFTSRGSTSSSLYTTTITNSGNSSFYNLTIPITGTSTTIITLNSLITISNNLLLSGSTTFTGTRGWTTNGFTCTTASAVITLQNANATFGSPLAAYNVTGPLTLQGTSTTTRITLQASGRVEFTGGITGSTMTIVSGAIQVGMTVSQRSGLIPTGLAPFITDRPVVTTGGGLSWTLNKTLTTPVPAGTLLSAGFKAIFNLTSTGTNVNVGLVTTQDIDSNGGQTILAALSNGDDTATNTALYRTLNWGPLIAPSGSVYYTWVD